MTDEKTSQKVTSLAATEEEIKTLAASALTQADNNKAKTNYYSEIIPHKISQD